MEALVAQLLMLPAAVATVNVGDKDGLTPLHWASTEGTGCCGGSLPAYRQACFLGTPHGMNLYHNLCASAPDTYMHISHAYLVCMLVIQ